MKKEDKELLFKDLCARLPYGVIVEYKRQEKEGDIKITCGNIGYVAELGNGWWKECKPYLRPMSSMTEEEKREYSLTKTLSIVDYPTLESFDWLNKNHFDYRGLIPKNIALDCTGLHIYD